MEWYVAANANGHNSLYRRQVTFPGTAPVLAAAEEVVENVTDFQLTYLESGTWTTALPTSWSNVTAVQVDMELEASDNRSGGVQGQMIKRRFQHVIALRNKL